jgi:diguanylate cyclase (GGDEF)-like protein
MDAIRRAFLIIPREYRKEFFHELYKENLLRIILCSCLIIVIEFIIFVLNGDILRTKFVILAILAFNLLLLPFFIVMRKKINKIPDPLSRSILTVYLIGTLLLGCAMSLMSQSYFATMNVYIITLFMISAFIYRPPLENLFIFFSTYLVFFLLIPMYQIYPEAVLILRTNAFIMNLLAWLLARMVYHNKLKSFQNLKLIEESNQMLREMAVRDSLTSLFNHASIYNMLRDEIEKSRVSKRKLCIIMLDVDDFKAVNDQYGHLIGDKVLKIMSGILMETCRTTDYVGRYGGEEFLIVLPNTGMKEACCLAERIRSNIEEADFENEIRITVSLGIDESVEETSAEDMIRGADHKLYLAKCCGKNRVITDQLRMNL